MATNVVGGTQIGTHIVCSANPLIGFAGIGQTSFGTSSTDGIQWNYWALFTALLSAFSQQPASGAANLGATFTNTVSAIADTNGGPPF